MYGKKSLLTNSSIYYIIEEDVVFSSKRIKGTRRMNTGNVVINFPKEKQAVPSATQQAKLKYQESVEEYLEQCRMIAICGNLRAIVHHQRMVEASDTYLKVLSNEVISQKNIFHKIFMFARFYGERDKVAKLRHMAQAEADKPQF